MPHRITLIEAEQMTMAAALFELQEMQDRRDVLLALIARSLGQIARLTRSA